MSDRKKISIGRFDENCEKALRYVKKSGSELIVYNQDGPIATIIPYNRAQLPVFDASVAANDHEVEPEGQEREPFPFILRKRPMIMDDTPDKKRWLSFSWLGSLARLGVLAPFSSRT